MPPTLQFPEDLRRYLDLANAQVDSINANNSAYLQFAAAKQARAQQLIQQIGQQTAANPLDPLAVGQSYAELETIRRDVRDQQAKTMQLDLTVLNDAQKAKLKTLADVQQLQTTIAQAQCENLLAPSVPNPFYSTGTVSGTATFLLGAVVTGVLSTVPYPACGVPYSPAPPYSLPEELRRYLDPSDAQIDAIGQLNADYAQLVAQKQQRSATIQQELQQEFAKDTLDPLAIGQRFVELEVIRRELQDQLTTLRTNAVADLNDTQRVKLTALDTARRTQPLAYEAQCENLLPAPEPAKGITGLPAIAYRSGDFSSSPLQIPSYIFSVMPSANCTVGPVLP